MMSPYRGVIRIESEDTVEEYAVDLSEAMAAFEEEIQAAREQARRWYTRWCYTFGALLVAVATVVWGAVYVLISIGGFR